jgi:L-serine dehydratase
MKAAAMFARALEADGQLAQTERVEVRLYGSLGATGKGHGTDTAVMLGLQGLMPDTIDPDTIDASLKVIRTGKAIHLNASKSIAFSEKTDVLFFAPRNLVVPPQWREVHGLYGRRDLDPRAPVFLCRRWVCGLARGCRCPKPSHGQRSCDGS